jgi:hypothetical protein
VKHKRLDAGAVLGDGDRDAEAAVCEVLAQAVASTVAARTSTTHKRINSVNAGSRQVVTYLTGHVVDQGKSQPVKPG